MQATYRRNEPNELFGGFALGAIALAILAAFAYSPLGTFAALIVAPIAFIASVRVDDSGVAALRTVQRVSLGVAVLGVVAAFVLF